MKNLVAKETNKKTKPEDLDFARPKKAFDSVMDAYSTLPSPPRFSPVTTEADRAASRLRIAQELAMTLPFYSEIPKKDGRKRGQGTLAAKGTPVKNPTAPSFTDFKIDVDKIIWGVVKSHQHRVEFVLRYVLGEERLTREQQHLFARFEQQIGRLFIKRGLFPVRSYMTSIRDVKKKPAQQLQETALPKAA
jgi:hypothetical protein